MSVKIRLSRVGKKHVPFYRIIVVDSRKKRDGQFLADIGTYDALNSKIVQFNEGLYTEWLGKGAQASDSTKRIHELYKRHGLGVMKKAEKPVKKAQPKVAKVEKVEEVTESTEAVVSKE